MSDYASELAARTVNDELSANSFPDGTDDLRRMIEGAVREALAKAVEWVREAEGDGVADEMAQHFALGAREGGR